MGAYTKKVRQTARARAPAATTKAAKPRSQKSSQKAIQKKNNTRPIPRLADQLLAVQKDEALFQKAVAMVMRKDYARPKKILFALTKKYPGNGLYWFNLGNIYFLTNEYENAVKCYRNVMFAKSSLAPAAETYLAKTYLAQNSIRDAAPILVNLEKINLPVGLQGELENLRNDFLEKVRLQAISLYRARRNDETIELLLWANKAYPRAEQLILVGMTWLRMGKPKRARTAFRVAKDLAKEQNLVDESDQFLRQIREGTWDADRMFFPYVDLSVGYNSNVFSEFFEPQAKMGYKVATGGVYHLHRGDSFFANFRYRLLWEEYNDLADDQFLTYTLSTQLLYDKDNWLFELSPRFQHQFVNMTSYLYKPGAFFRAQRRFDNYEAGFSIDYGSGKATQDESSYLAGPTSSVTLFWNRYWQELQATLFVFGEREDIGIYEPVAGDSYPLAFEGYGPGARIVWYPNDAWEFSGGLTHSIRKYRPITAPENIQRDDTQTSLWTRTSFRLDKDISLYVSADFAGNRSTLDSTNYKNKNYNQGSIFGGFTWELSL